MERRGPEDLWRDLYEPPRYDRKNFGKSTRYDAYSDFAEFRGNWAIEYWFDLDTMKAQFDNQLSPKTPDLALTNSWELSYHAKSFFEKLDTEETMTDGIQILDLSVQDRLKDNRIPQEGQMSRPQEYYIYKSLRDMFKAMYNAEFPSKIDRDGDHRMRLLDIGERNFQ